MAFLFCSVNTVKHLGFSSALFNQPSFLGWTTGECSVSSLYVVGFDLLMFGQGFFFLIYIHDALGL